jgi:K(+)-stimulated pyrophosphate-energized sodium pump
LGVLTGQVEPDYETPIAISTTATQKELISLALLGVVTPVVVGIALRIETLGCFLAGDPLWPAPGSHFFLNNAGGTWNNAKKAIEDE